MKLFAYILSGAFLLTTLAALTVSANPVIPYCPGAAAVAPGVAPNVVQPDVCEAVTGRVFPEAIARPEYAMEGNQGYASDYVSFPEFEAGMRYLEQQYPDMITVHEVGRSYGLPKTPGGTLDSWPIYIVEVTNEKSPVPMEDRLELLFMLSIHGNEKGGREGGMRVLEDLAAGRGIHDDVVQNGAGMPTPLAKPGGGDVQTYSDYLDFMRLFFMFPNVDGWMHDEAPYVAVPFCGTLFCRTNGNGTDLNRQTPTIGWQMMNANSGRIAVNEPEARGYLPWLVTDHQWSYAIDIHGMLNHENFVAIMMPAGSLSPQEMQRSTRLAETLKERLNQDDHFSAWKTVMGAGETAGGAAGGPFDQTPACTEAGVCTDGQSPTTVAGSSEFSDWSTVWDAIGYTDSGFSGDFFAQSSGLNAPGYDIELAYNHITVDSQYEAGAFLNDYHVHTVRHIFKSFMDAAALDVQVSYETGGLRTLVLEPQYVATNLDDKDENGNPRPTPGGWADANPHDDAWQYSASRPMQARPAKYWSDMLPFLQEGERPGVLHFATAARLTPAVLAQYDTLVVPGSAINQFVAGDATSNAVATGAADDARLKIILDWVRAGGNLVLTDAALKFFDLAGLTQGAVNVNVEYAGAIDLRRDHELAAGVRGEARQMYEPVPLGFDTQNSAPIWSIDAAAFEAIGGDVAGEAFTGAGGAAEAFDGDAVGLGRVALDAGRIQFLGALLPDPTEEFYHPYGLDDYATTYSGNQVLRNMLGWTEVFAAPPIVITGEGEIRQSQNEPALNFTPVRAGEAQEADGAQGTPGPLGAEVIAVVVLGLVLFARRRKTA